MFLDNEDSFVWYPECGFEVDLRAGDAERYSLPFDPEGRLN